MDGYSDRLKDCAADLHAEYLRMYLHFRSSPPLPFGLDMLMQQFVILL